MTTLRARFNGQVLVPEGPVDLPTNRILEIDVRDEDVARGSPELLKRFLKAGDSTPAEDLQIMLDAIEEANQLPDDRELFDEEGSLGSGQ
jgi:hypothetical protein